MGVKPEPRGLEAAPCQGGKENPTLPWLSAVREERNPGLGPRDREIWGIAQLSFQI